MALVVFLRGVNVGGHRTFRPTVLARQLKHLGAVNIGAAGTLIFRRPASHADLRAALVRRLPFDTAIMICDGRDILRLVSRDPFAGEPLGRDVVRFVSVLPKRPRSGPPKPLRLPGQEKWLLKIVGSEGRFVLGVYRRHMKVIGYIGSLDRILGAPVTTRNWNTMTAVAAVLRDEPAPR
jgi:uncharacterized protein (DUF1697 family)